MERFRLFSLLLYEDTTDYNFKEVLKNIRGFKYYVFIKHDKDTIENGDFKKIHYHIIIKLENATTIKALSKKLGIKEQFIQNIRNERSYIRYLLHFDNEDKYQYSFDSLFMSRSYQRQIKKCFEDKETEEQVIANIQLFINENVKIMSKQDFLYLFIQYINSNCYDTIYKRYRQEFNTLINLCS